MTAITGPKPNAIGDLPSFTITLTPPASSPLAVATGVTVAVCKPDGTLVTPASATGSGLAWSYTAVSAIDAPGRWTWRVVTTGGLVDATEFFVDIPKSPFT